MGQVRGREAKGSCDTEFRNQDGTKVPRKDRFMQRAGVEVCAQFRWRKTQVEEYRGKLCSSCSCAHGGHWSGKVGRTRLRVAGRRAVVLGRVARRGVTCGGDSRTLGRRPRKNWVAKTLALGRRISCHRDYEYTDGSLFTLARMSMRLQRQGHTCTAALRMSKKMCGASAFPASGFRLHIFETIQ